MWATVRIPECLCIKSRKFSTSHTLRSHLFSWPSERSSQISLIFCFHATNWLKRYIGQCKSTVMWKTRNFTFPTGSMEKTIESLRPATRRLWTSESVNGVFLGVSQTLAVATPITNNRCLFPVGLWLFLLVGCWAKMGWGLSVGWKQSWPRELFWFERGFQWPQC